MTNSIAPRFAVLALTLLGAPVAIGQVAEAGFPTSQLTTMAGPTNPVSWQGWALTGQNYGAGNDANGASGSYSHTYVGGNLTQITVNLRELRNSSGPLVFINNPYARNYGQIVFTPAVNMPYTLGGAVPILLSGTAASTSSASGFLFLEVVSGPMLASFGTSLNRGGGLPVMGNLYDSASPLSGSPPAC